MPKKITESFKALVRQNLTFSKSEDNILGVGGFGKVYKGTYLDQGKHKAVAIKLLKGVDISNSKDLKQEASTLSCLNHHNIIRLYGICEINPKTPEWGIVLEFANLGTLKEHVLDLTSSQATKACLDMFQGLQYLHSKGYIHRDMKLENILLLGDLNSGFIAKIADFGLSRETDLNMTPGRGTCMYMAPEMVEDPVQYTNKVDVYSSSIIVFEVFTKERFPFPHTSNPMQQIVAIRRSTKPQIPAHIPRTLQTLIAKGWSRQPQERPKVNEFIEAFEELVETFSTVGDLPEMSVKINRQNHARNIGKDIFSGTAVFAFQWAQDLEEGNSRELRTKMVDDIKKNYDQAAKILPHVLTALQNVPKHKFMDAEVTPGKTRSEKIERIYTCNKSMGVVGNAHVGGSGFLGLQLSMLKIDVGMDVLVVSGRGYIESLVSQLVGPKGKVTVVDTSKQCMETLSSLMREIEPERNIAFYTVDKYEITSEGGIFIWQSGVQKKLPIVLKFDAIFYSNIVECFPDHLKCLIKEEGTLLAPVIPAGKDSGNLEVYMAANSRLKKPAEKRTITDFTIVKIIDGDL